ncbi:MAG: glycosyltransferase, partial [Candidatus Odinarchaeota archaeon]|nr:glycosyltransferase [Candidatus Odinarchaeota archaeon]
IVDGGSTDNTLEILRKYENEYNLRWISEPDEGQSDAVNKGFRMAKGEIIGWLNSDDVYFTRDVISYVVEKFEKNPSVDVIYGDTAIINYNNVILTVIAHAPTSYNRLRILNQIGQPATFFKRNNISYIMLDIDLHYAMDYELWLRLIGKGFKFKYVAKILACNRHHTTAKTVSQREKLDEEIKLVQKKYGQYFGMNYRFLRLLEKGKKGILRVRGISKALDICLNSECYDFAFEARFDSALKTLLRQIAYPEIQRFLQVIRLIHI